MTDEEELEGFDLAAITRSAARDDAQPFMTIRRLSDGGALPKVWHRYFSGDFMAEVYVRRRGAKQDRRITATGEGLEDAMANLATAVADFLNPVGPRRRRK